MSHKSANDEDKCSRLEWTSERSFFNHSPYQGPYFMSNIKMCVFYFILSQTVASGPGGERKALLSPVRYVNWFDPLDLIIFRRKEKRGLSWFYVLTTLLFKMSPITTPVLKTWS